MHVPFQGTQGPLQLIDNVSGKEIEGSVHRLCQAYRRRMQVWRINDCGQNSQKELELLVGSENRCDVHRTFYSEISLGDSSDWYNAWNTGWLGIVRHMAYYRHGREGGHGAL